MMASFSTPKDVFDQPDMGFLCSSKFERQYFERKAAPNEEQCRRERPERPAEAIMRQKVSDLREGIQAALGGFAVVNRDPSGGLFALGISDDGHINGLKHLAADQLQRLVNTNQLLEHVNCQTKRIDCLDRDGEQNFVYLIYVSFAPNAIPCTPDASARSWKRVDSHSILLTTDEVQQLKIDRGILPFETQSLMPFSEDELDQELAEIFRKAVVEEQQLPLDASLTSILFNKGVLDKKNGSFYWTRAGYLFLGVNPRRKIEGAYIRIARVEGRRSNVGSHPNPSFDREFDGPLPRQITRAREFLRQSAFFNHYEYRNADGSLVREPEYPNAAWEEAIVNAVVHRSYAMSALPIRVIKYTDCLIVESPGSFAQPMPKSEFPVSEVPVGRSRPRNPKLMEWLRLMSDERNERYVKQWQEGTRTIADVMRTSAKPEPLYKTNGDVILVSENSLDALEARVAAGQVPGSPRFGNLFPLHLSRLGAPFTPSSDEWHSVQKSITLALRDRLLNESWYIDAERFGELVAHKRQSHFPIPSIDSLVRIYPAYRFHVRRYGDQPYLVIDLAIREKNVRVLSAVLGDVERKKLVGQRAIFRQNQQWQHITGFLRSIGQEHSELWLPDERQTIRVFNSDILPDVRPDQLRHILAAHHIRFDLAREVKQRALSLTHGAARERAIKTLAISSLIAKDIFPLHWEDVAVTLEADPAPLRPPVFDVKEGLLEPRVEFRSQQKTADITDGLTRYGSVRPVGDAIHLVLVHTPNVQQSMDQLVRALQKGSHRYRGAEPTFGTRFEIGRRVVTPRPEDYVGECQRILGDLEPGKVWLFLVYMPDRPYSRSDYTAPYYRMKRFLLENGFASQMVDEDTVSNTEWKDLNIALNITAKCGYEPWVLSSPLAEVDCFIGLSYSTLRTPDRVTRLFGYTNVFTNLGQWKYYRGSTESCAYDERDSYTAELIRTALADYERHVSIKNVHIHSTERFGRRMIEAVATSARQIRRDVTLHFVHINSTHPIRMYDQDPQGDGSLKRGAYVITSPHQFYLSTTGYNLAQKTLGTPITLEVNARTVDAGQALMPNLDCIAQHLLSLTKLNWASTRQFCGEPITTKYAGDIAYFMNAFLASDPGKPFRLSPRLEKTPWFL